MRRLRIASIAMAVAAVIWVLLAAATLGLLGLGQSGTSRDLTVLALAGAVFDAFVAVRLWRQQWARAIFLYVCVRAVVAAARLVFICLPFYLVAVIAVPSRVPTGDSSQARA